MTEKEFKGLLIEMVKRGNNLNKRRILEILERSILSCDKTNEFTKRKWNYCKEYIYITVEPSDVMELMNHKKYIEQIIEQIYPVNEDYKYELFGVEIKPGRVSPDEFVSQEIYFENIQDQIIDELKKAKYTIWVAMAWFTNKKLFDVLVEKRDKVLMFRW